MSPLIIYSSSIESVKENISAKREGLGLYSSSSTLCIFLIIKIKIGTIVLFSSNYLSLELSI